MNSRPASPGRSDRPNILYVFTDQQSYKMMSCFGNEYVNTPAMDSIAENGVRFDHAYCTNPVCVPSRFSMMTGRMPSAIGQRANPSRHLDPIPDEIKQQGLGWLVRGGGYDAVYGGKVHLPKGLSPEDLGFETIEKDQRDGLADTCADYLLQDHENPFLMVASFINPHDICYMGIRAFAESDFDHMLLENGQTELACLDEALQMPEDVDEEEFFETVCPPLPPNFEPQDDEPEMIGELLRERTFRWNERTKWSARDWRMHRWAYVGLTERVDRQIGRVLDALRRGPHADNTLVIFSSDHGDHDASHKLEHKTMPYEEAARIPLLASPPGGRTPAVDRHLVSNGCDLLPTVCDYAGVAPPENLNGRSLRPLIEGDGADDWRDVVWVESQNSLAIRTERYKYVLYDEGENREQLYDLLKDPHETRNFAGDPDKQDALRRHRDIFQKTRAEWAGR